MSETEIFSQINEAVTIFLPWFQGKKNEAVRLRFMHRRCASWHNVPLHTAKPCFIKAWRWSIVSLPLHNMKQLHFIQLWSIRSAHMMGKWKMRVYPFAIQRYPHYIITCNPVLYGWIFLCLDFTQWMTGTYSLNSPKQSIKKKATGYRTLVFLMYHQLWFHASSRHFYVLFRAAFFQDSP